MRAEIFDILGKTSLALEELNHVQSELIPQAMDSVRERIGNHHANKTRLPLLTFDATAAKNARQLAVRSSLLNTEHNPSRATCQRHTNTPSTSTHHVGSLTSDRPLSFSRSAR